MSTIATTSDTSTRSTLALKRSDVVDLLSMAECIDAVEAAFEAHARGCARGPEVVSLYVDGGGFHMKAVGLVLSRPYFAAKTNGNFFHNDRLQLPRIKGTIVLCDASNGSPLALLDSIEITTLRTAAATAVAARRFALPDASSLAIIGCGIQGHATWRAIVECFPIDRVYLCDPNREAVNSLFELAERTGATPEITPEPGSAVRAAQICVTCTPATEPIVRRKDVHPGVFLAAVGADSEIKQELDLQIAMSSEPGYR